MNADLFEKNTNMNNSRLIIGDYCTIVELKDRYVSLEKNFNDYRRKTLDMLSKKDCHINRLQDRLNSLVDNGQQDAHMHTLKAERDAFATKLSQLERAYDLERSNWTLEFEKLRQQRGNFHEKSICSMDFGCQKDADNVQTEIVAKPANNNYTINNNIGNKNNNKICECDFLKKELERYKIESTNFYSKGDHSNQQANVKNIEEKLLDSIIVKTLKQELELKNEETKNLRDQLTSVVMERDEMLKNFELDLVNKNNKNKHNQINHDKDKDIIIENELLKKQLDYFENMDVESEQQITVMANQLEEMNEILEQKEKDYIVLTQEMMERKQDLDQCQQKSKTLENQTSRQKDIIENLRDECDKMKDKQRETQKDRDDLLLRNASLSHEVDFNKRLAMEEREHILHQLKLASQELDEYKERLRQKEMEETDNNRTLLKSLNAKVQDLEETLIRKQEIVDSLERRLSNATTTSQDTTTLTNNSRSFRKSSSLSKSEYDLSSLNSGSYYTTNNSNSYYSHPRQPKQLRTSAMNSQNVLW